MTAKIQTTEFDDTKLDNLTDEEIELLSSIEGRNRHDSRRIAKRQGYTWERVQTLRKLYLRSIGKGD